MKVTYRNILFHEKLLIFDNPRIMFILNILIQNRICFVIYARVRIENSVD